MFAAALSGYLTVIGSHFGHGAIAPAVADVPEFVARSGKNLVLLGGNVHLFRPKIFAEIWVHGSWESVIR